MAKRGPKPRVIDWELVDNLAAIFCTQREIQDAVGCDSKVMERACRREHDCTWAEYCDQRRDRGRRNLRRMQMQAALKGNITMMIWLGKNLLNQSDRQEVIDKRWAEKTSRDKLVEMGKQAIASLEKQQADKPQLSLVGKEGNKA